MLYIFCGCNRDSTIYMGIENIPVGLDPVKNTGIYEVQVYSQIFETLFKLKNDYQTIEANLLDNWQISEDHLNYRLQLKPGIRFQNGKPLEAADVIYSIRRYQNLHSDWILRDIVDQASTVDSMTIEIQLKRPYALLLYALCSPYVLVVQTPSKIGDYRDLNPDLVGTGPFSLKANGPDGAVELTLNPFGRLETGDVTGIRFLPYLDHASMAGALKDGAVDIIYMISSKMIDRLKWSGKINYLVIRPVNIQFIGFDNMREPFNDIRIRRAFLEALDVARIVYNTNRGNAEVAHGPLPPIYSYLSMTRQDGYHPDHAQFVLSGLNAGSGSDF